MFRATIFVVFVFSIGLLSAMQELPDCRQKSAEYWQKLVEYAFVQWHKITPHKDFSPLNGHLLFMGATMQVWYTRRDETISGPWPWYIRLLEDHASSPTFQIDCEASKRRLVIALLNNLARHLPQELESEKSTLQDLQAAMEPIATSELNDRIR